MTPSKKIAVTGGIGSGKTMLCGFLRDMGYPVFSCDEISAALWREKDYVNGLMELFPAFVTGGVLQKPAFTAAVFADRELRARLEAYAHPRIMERLLARMARERVSFAEVPLLYEGGFAPLFDGVVVVARESEKRIRAVCRRDGISEDEVRARMHSQRDWTAGEMSGVYVVMNNGSAEDLRRKAGELIKFFQV